MAEARPGPAGGGLFARGLGTLRAELAALDREAALADAPRAGQNAAITFVTAALCLIVMEYLAGPRLLGELADALHALWPGSPSFRELRLSRWLGLSDLTLWVLTRALGFVVLPALVIRFWLRRPVSSFGILPLPAPRKLKPYLALFALVLPLLVVVSLRPEFRAYYPFYRRASESVLDLLLWEGLYAFQFFCVEFFFRGFLLFGTHERLGSLSLFAAVIPYCMVHFTKPLLEVLGAIPAGLVLGLLALRTRSIWGGVLVHVAVAWTMDALALLHGPGLPTRFWP